MTTSFNQNKLACMYTCDTGMWCRLMCMTRWALPVLPRSQPRNHIRKLYLLIVFLSLSLTLLIVSWNWLDGMTSGLGHRHFLNQHEQLRRENSFNLHRMIYGNCLNKNNQINKINTCKHEAIPPSTSEFQSDRMKTPRKLPEVRINFATEVNL